METFYETPGEVDELDTVLPPAWDGVPGSVEVSVAVDHGVEPPEAPVEAVEPPAAAAEPSLAADASLV